MGSRGPYVLLALLLTVAKGSATSCGSAGNLQVVDGSNRTEGRLNICRNEEWGTVCYQDTGTSKRDFNNASAAVACFQLGFAGAQAWYTKDRFKPGTIETWLRNVNCTGTETKLEQCGLWCTNEQSCSYCDQHHFDVGISCADDWQVKLVHNSVNSYGGTVYHYYSNTWAILCDEGWDIQSATVVCNQLGLGNAMNSSTSVFHGTSIHKFLLTNTNCIGTEHFLKDCSLKSNLWKISQNCSGQHVAEVKCEGPVLNIVAESSTPTSISLKWTAADDRYNFYPANESYDVAYAMDDIEYILLTDDKGITVPGLKADTEYTFKVQAVIHNGFDVGPIQNVSYHTKPKHALHQGSKAAIGLGVAVVLITLFAIGAAVLAVYWYKRSRAHPRQQPEDLHPPPENVQPVPGNVQGNDEHQRLIPPERNNMEHHGCTVQ